MVIGLRLMEHPLYPAASSEFSRKRKELAPETYSAFIAFSQQVFADGALTGK